jgi:hypothetical protein
MLPNYLLIGEISLIPQSSRSVLARYRAVKKTNTAQGVFLAVPLRETRWHSDCLTSLH